MHNDNIDSYMADFNRVQAIIGNESSHNPSTPENLSRDRLLRAQVGLLHLLTEVTPQITDEKQRHEVYLFVCGIYDLTRQESADAVKQRQEREAKA